MLLLAGGMLTPGGPMLLLEGGRGDMLLLAGDMLVLGGPLVVGYLLLNTELFGVPGLGAGGGPFITGGGRGPLREGGAGPELTGGGGPPPPP